MAEVLASAPPKPRSKLRRTFGCLVTAPLGCLAFFLGALLAVVAMTPNLLSPWFTRLAVDGFDHDRAGKLELEAIELHWFDRQSVRNLAIRSPEGETVVRGSASFPGLFDLLQNGFDDLGRIDVTVEEADLRVLDDGTTNLDRALELQVSRGNRQLDLDLTELRDNPARWSIRVESLSWQDARTRRAGRPFEIEDVECVVEVLADGRTAVEIIGKEGVQLDVAFVWRGARNPDERPYLDLERVRLQDLPSSMLDTLSGRSELFTRLLGPTFDLTGFAREDSAAEGGVELSLTSERAELSLAATRAGGDLRAPGVALEGTLLWSEPLFTELLGELPARVGLGRDDPDQPLTIALSDLAVPHATLAAGSTWRERLAGLRATVDLGLGDWTCRRSPPAGAAAGHAPVPEAVRLDDLRLRGGLGARADVPGANGGGASEPDPLELRLADASDALALRLAAPDLSALAAVLDGEALAAGEPAGWAVLEAEALPAPAVDRWLGPTARVELDPPDAVPLTLELDRAQLHAPVADAPPGAGRLEAALRVHVPRLALGDPARSGADLVLVGLEGELEVAPGRGTHAELEGRIEGGEPGSARTTLDRPEPGAGTARAGALEWNLRLAGVPAAFADAWFGTGRWIADLLGARLETLELSYDRTPGGAAGARGDTGAAHAGARLSSARGRIAVAGALEGGALVAEAGTPAEASFELTPACAKPVIAWMAPLLADVAAAPGGERAILRLSDFRVPVGGRGEGLGGLSANIEVTLGPFTYRVLPPLAERMLLAPELRAGRSPGRTFRLRVEQGLARYADSEIPIGPDHTLPFSGSQDLETGELNLTAHVPMSLLVEGEEGLLDMLQGVLEDEDAAPVVAVQGTYEEPSVLIDTYGLNDFVLGLGERALREALPAFLDARRKE